MKNLNKILVLLTTYNGERFLKDQLNSIFAQKNVAVTVLARDDGSTDTTLKILDEFSNTNNIIILNGKQDTKHGAMHNFYTLIKYAKDNYVDNFDYFAFSDQDDVWKSDKLNTMACAISKNDRPQLAYCNYEVIDENNKLISKNIDSEIGLKPINDATLLFTNSFAWGHSIIFNAMLLANINVDTEVINSNFPHDAYFAKFAVITDGLVYVPQVLVSYRRYSSNVSDIWYKLTFSRIFQQIKIERKVYANIVNATLLVFEKNKNEFINYKLTTEVTKVIKDPGIKTIEYFKKNSIERKQKSRKRALYVIYTLGIYKKYLGLKEKIKIN